jgi:hypothetical protein
MLSPINFFARQRCLISCFLFSIMRLAFKLLQLLDKVRKSVTWNTSLNCVDKNNKKAKKRHLELVVARALRAREADRLLVRGLE